MFWYLMAGIREFFVLYKEKCCMSIETVLKNICRMPIDFERLGDVSMIHLLEESGYIESRNDITEDNIIGYLKEDKDIVDAWIRHSEDQRCTPSWYFNGQTVGYLNSSGQSEKENYYDDPLKGCASYIKLMMEDLIKD
jgi:hypothetical protein